MSHEMQLIFLRRMNEALMKIALEIAGGKLPEAGSPETAELNQKLAVWQKQLALLTRDLKSRRGFLAVQYAGTMRGRSPAAYAARQSYASRMANADALEELVEAAQGWVAQILMGLGIGAALELLKDGADAAAKGAQGDLGHELTHIVQQSSPDAILRGGGPSDMPAFAGSSTLTMVLALWAGIALIRLRLTGGED